MRVMGPGPASLRPCVPNEYSFQEAPPTLPVHTRFCCVYARVCVLCRVVHFSVAVCGTECCCRGLVEGQPYLFLPSLHISPLTL